MAVAYVSDTDKAPATAASFTYTTFAVSGTNPVIIVTVALAGTTAHERVSTVVCSGGLTGTATEIIEFTGTPTAGQAEQVVSIWAIAAPSGTGTITVTFTGSAAYQSNAALFSGADQTTPCPLADAASSEADSGGGTISLTPANLTANDAAVIMGGNVLGDSPNVTTGTEIYADNTSDVNVAVGYHIGTGALVVTWDNFNSPGCAAAAVRIASAPASASFEVFSAEFDSEARSNNAILDIRGTGYLDMVSAYSVSAGNGGTRAWISAGNTGSLFSAARASDDVRVLADDLSANGIIFPFFAQFSAALPNNAEVQGFAVRYERRATTTAVSANETWIKLVSGAGAGAQFQGTTANANTGNWSTTETTVTAGGAGSMFGMTTADASAGRINTQRFGFAVNLRYGAATTITSAAATIDLMQLQVYYRTRQAETVAPEYDWEVNSVSIASGLGIGAQSAEFDYEAKSVQLFNVGVSKSEYDWEGYSGLFVKNFIVNRAEFDYEFLSGDFEPVAIVGSAEFDREIAFVGQNLVINAQAAEFDREFLSVSVVAAATTIGVSTAEYDYEAGSDGLVRNIVVQSSEYDRDVASLGFGTTIGISSSEYVWELQPVDVTDITPVHAAFFHATQSTLAGKVIGTVNAEFGYESLSGTFSTVVRPNSAEFDGEWLSLNFPSVVSVEMGWESPTVALTQNRGVQSAEFDSEWSSTQFNSFAVGSPEFDFEVSDIPLTQNHRVLTAEFEREFGSVNIQRVVLAAVPEFGSEWSSPALLGSIGVREAEFDSEWSSPRPALQVSLGTQGAEFDFEARSPNLPGAGSAVVRSAEFDWESKSVRLRNFGRSGRNPKRRHDVQRRRATVMP